MENPDIWKEIFNYGTPLVILTVITLGLWKFGKWASELIKDAILAPETGWLAVINRNANATENYLSETAERDKAQQALCEEHTNSLHEVSTILEQHVEISKRINNDLGKLREESKDPSSPYSTVAVSKDVSDIKEALVEACHAIREGVRQHNPTIAAEVSSWCDRIEYLLKGQQ